MRNNKNEVQSDKAKQIDGKQAGSEITEEGKDKKDVEE